MVLTGLFPGLLAVLLVLTEFHEDLLLSRARLQIFPTYTLLPRNFCSALLGLFLGIGADLLGICADLPLTKEFRTDLVPQFFSQRTWSPRSSGTPCALVAALGF